ncbi:MAG TPA: LuxR C-terminal-related transcriptional regulator [Pseudonocardiaceae bacterium]|nr:LuxR C-terminal-related transcriptional regulator [Pseudonocardiaceae bacterium]
MTEKPTRNSSPEPPSRSAWRGGGRADLRRSPRAAPPALRLLPPGSMPTPAALIGRDELFDDLRTRVLNTRMVTLTGPGGVGKTELALHCAWSLSRDGGDLKSPVVRWVPLDTIGNDAALDIDRAVVAALGIHDFGHRTLDEVDAALRDYFGRARNCTVLVLDNCEHLVDEAADLCQMLLDTTARYPDRLRILCTSREALACSVESVVTVNPLAYPETDKDIGNRPVWPAIAMFNSCIERFGNPLPADPDIVKTVARIVRNAAGLPLAIKIAASLGRQASLEQILAWTSVTSPGRRRRPGDGTERDGRVGVIHEGLRRAFTASTRARDWTEEHDRALQRLAVAFDGTFAADAADAICPDFESDQPGRIRAEDVPDLLSALVDKSLVAVDTSETEARFQLLRPIRKFAIDRLNTRDRDEVPLLRERHVRYYYDLADVVTNGWTSPDELDVVRQAQLDMHNFRAAMAESWGRPELAPMGVGIANSLAQTRLWHRTGDLAEGRYALQRAAEALAAIPGAEMLCIGTKANVAWYALCQGELDEARRYLRECLEPFAGLDEQYYSSAVLQILAVYLNWVDRNPHSIELSKLALTKCVQESTVVLDGTFRDYPPELDDLMHLMCRQGLNYGVLISSLFGALAGAFLGDGDEARGVVQDFADRAEDCGAPTIIAWSRMTRAIALMRHSEPGDEDLNEALRLAADAVVDLIEMGELWGSGWAQHLVVSVRGERLRRAVKSRGAINQEDKREALQLAMLSGAARKTRDTSNVKLPGFGGLQDWYLDAVRLSRDVAGSWAWDAAENKAYTLDDDQALRLGTPLGAALDTMIIDARPQDAIPDAIRAEWNSLSEQQQKVTYLVAGGRTGASIAAALHIAEKTVDRHASRAKEKLGITGHRNQLAGLYPIIERLWAENHPHDPDPG